MKSAMKYRSGGFTLVELIVVLIILGVLAATIAPRFFDFSSAARQGAVRTLAASVTSAAQMARAIQLTSGLTSGASVTMEGTTISMSLGYPTITSIASAVTFDTDVFTHVTSGSTASFRVQAVETPANCSATYTVPTTSGSAPSVSYVITGCD